MSAIIKTEENLKMIQGELGRGAIQDQIGIALSDLRRWVTPEKLIRVALTAIRGDEKLAISTPVSIIGSVIQLAQVGLVPDGFLGQAYLIPYWNKDLKRFEASPLIGYRGYGELAIRSGKATSVDAHVIYSGDSFDYEYGDTPFLKYRLQMDPKKRGEIIGAYAIVYMKEGPHRFEIMPLDQIEKVKGSSQGADSKYSPWVTWYDEMCRKSPLRRLAKWVPLSPEFQMAAGIDESSELGLQRTVIDDSTGQVFFVPKGESTESVVERPSRIVEQPQPQSTEKPKTNCLCTCCKTGSCECAGKPEAQRCGCSSCKNGGVGDSPSQVDHPQVEETRRSEGAPSSSLSAADVGFTQAATTKPAGPYVAQQKIAKLMAVARSADLDDTAVHNILKSKWNIDSRKEIPEPLYDDVLKTLGGDKLNIK